jgi:hypothetical protein
MRQIDSVLFNEAQGTPKSLYTFDIGKFDHLVEEDQDELDDLKGLTDEPKVKNRVIGEFIQHESFNDEFLEDEVVKE